MVYGDHAYTFTVGEVKEDIKKLLEVTKESHKGIEKLKVGNRIGDVSAEIQQFTESHGYGVVRELVGHGLGKSLHEEQIYQTSELKIQDQTKTVW